MPTKRVVTVDYNSQKLPTIGRILKCEKCHRQILVEDMLIGTNHTVATVVTCWDCLTDWEKTRAREEYKISETIQNKEGTS